MKTFRNAPFYYWLILGVFIIIYAGFGLVFFQKQTEHRDLEAQIAPNRLILQKPHPDLESLEEELGQAEAELATMWVHLPIPEEAIELFDALIEVAQSNDVEVISVTGAPPVRKERGDGTSYSVFSFNLTVQGSRDAILTFVSQLSVGSELLQGVQLENMDIAGGTSEDTTDTANLRLVIPTEPDLAT